MKASRFSPIATFFLCCIFLLSCSSMNNLTMSVTEPAPVFVPNHIKRVGLLNRSQSTTNKTLDKIDKILSAEGQNLDKEGADEVVQGIKDAFEKNQTFEAVLNVESDKIENPGLGIFPNTLSWDMVNTLCNENDVDALVELSFYDTDAAIKYNVETVQKVNALGLKIPVIEHIASVNTAIQTGFRIYDNSSKELLDEIIFRDGSLSVGRGLNPVKAAEAITGRKEGILQISNAIGHSYALRTYPFRIRVTREYYVKGTNNFEIAKRRAQTGDWDGAAQLWEVETNHPKSKIAGRAHYNMAIINEINGDLDAAIAFASKAYTDYKDKNALRYLRVLENRKFKNRVLEEQSR